MNKLQKSLALIATLAIASTSLVACGGGETSTPATTTKAGSTTAAAGSTTAAAGSTTAAAAGSTTAAAGSDAATTTGAAAPAGENKFKDDGAELSVLCWTPDDVTKMNEFFETKYPDYKGKVKYVNVGSKGQEAHEQYSQYFKGDKDVDLFVMEADWILDYIDNDDYTAPVTDLGFSTDDFKGNYAYTVAIGTNSKGVLKGASWQATPGAYVYNKEMAEKYLGAKTPAEMQAFVKDWDTFTATAKKLQDDGHKIAMADTLGGMWQVWQYNRASAWADKDDNLVIDDFCKKYADLAKEYYEKGYVTKEAQWSDGWNAMGQGEDTMGFFFCTWCLGKGGQLEKTSGGEGKANYGKFDICAGPSQWAWGGSWLGVSPKCNNGKMAHDYVKCFTVDPATMEEYALFKGEFVNSPTVMKKIVDEKKNQNPALGGADQFAVLYDSASKIDMNGKITKFDSQIKDAFNKSVEKYCKGEVKDYAAMEDDFKKAAAQIAGLNVQ